MQIKPNDLQYLSEAEKIVYRDLLDKQKRKEELSFSEQTKLMYYGAKASYLNSAPPLERATLTSMRSEESDLENIVDYYSKKNSSGELSEAELDVYVKKKGELERKQTAEKEAEIKEQKAKDDYKQAKKNITRDAGGSLQDLDLVAKYEDEHSVAGFLVSSGTKQNILDAIDRAEALTEEQNKRSVRGYSIYDADSTENSVGNSYDDKDIQITEQQKAERKEVLFPFPEEVKIRKHRLVAVGTNINGEEYKLIPGELEEIKDINAEPKKIEMVGKSPEKQYSKEFVETKDKDYKNILDGIFRANGLGLVDHQYSTWMKFIDRSQINIVPHNTETSDITLMTRPSLPMNSMSLLTDSFLSQFDTKDVNSIYYGIRCLLDKKWASGRNDGGKSPFFNPLSPWLTPVTNGLIGISGFPDPIIETETTEGGYHQEDQTYVKGGLGLFRSQQLQLNFKDVQGGPLMNLFLAWITIMAQLRDGRIMAYLGDINKNVIPYSVGIYHFNLDPTKNYITNWAKCTMCFPISVPFGSLMNKSENQRYITSAGEFSVPFMCNFFHYRNLSDLRAFNMLAERYWPGIGKAPNLPLHKNNNYDGLPYILNDFNSNKSGGFRLVYKKLPEGFLPKDASKYLSTR